MIVSDTSALVLFSGGQDSTVCLAWALAHYERVETIGFRYGQRHDVELAQRQIVRGKLAKLGDAGKRLGPDAVLDLPALQNISETALTRETEITFAATGLPTTFVPGRNLLFLTYAAALAYRRGIATLVGGMCETDFSGYPDCRNETIQTLAQAISLGLATSITIETPLMFINKAGTWEMASELGGDELIDIIVEDTHTCYMGDRANRHEWGYGCGICPACDLRAKGWAEWQARKT
ncbi:MAG: 7-cyano-7-deazaguanine synthase QueC [Proteobacteria bacterium]|nr:7-cyano-7-deazaguanine synthase QueC [Pseudomonadota bacterium]